MNNIYGIPQNIANHESSGASTPSNSYGDSRYDLTQAEKEAAFYELLQAHADHISSKRAMELLASPQG